ncbi:SDR family NAD(P)-dependent oxidoreductase [Pseudofrankia sp. DC12]|uniref:SDR family NAD(P)-dependent oxidoreductase n=1 Tax=Pseudofrankia sp. DC12 TaxID=683315 RepID=UPI0005F87660|nr:SDR family NAD(P)-dependent oxidoreductase [Pseudofrankia sp. DC12]
MNLQGRSAIVTGGAGGLGSATVHRLVEIGMHAVIFDRDADRAAELAKELGDSASAVSGDVLADDDVTAAIDAARAVGPLSLLVNVAGGGAGGGRLVARDGTPHDKTAFIRTLEMNVLTTFNMTRLTAAAMAGNQPDEFGQRGVVVNTASIAGMEGRTGQVAYASAKAAILGMTLPMARDLAPIGVRVCAIAPGTMGTPIMYTLREELREKLVEGIVFPHRFGRPEEYALLVEAIATNPYLNGENIRLDGALRFAP